MIGLLLPASVVLVRLARPWHSGRRLAQTLVIVDQQSQQRDACAGLPGARPVYPYSVIRGGACSAEELERAVVSDAAVAVHYSDLNPAKFRLAQLRSPVAAYVSYRKGANVYWTARRVWLRRNEYVLTDGTHHIRARCGNRISIAPLAPTAPNEDPVRVAMDLPQLPPLPMEIAETVKVTPPVPELPSQARRPVYPPIPVPPVPQTVTHVVLPPLVVTPEPGTLILMSGVAAGYGAVLVLRRLRRTSKRSRR
jgi:hypothetical protein